MENLEHPLIKTDRHNQMVYLPKLMNSHYLHNHRPTKQLKKKNQVYFGAGNLDRLQMKLSLSLNRQLLSSLSSIHKNPDLEPFSEIPENPIIANRW